MDEDPIPIHWLVVFLQPQTLVALDPSHPNEQVKNLTLRNTYMMYSPSSTWGVAKPCQIRFNPHVETTLHHPPPNSQLMSLKKKKTAAAKGAVLCLQLQPRISSIPHPSEESPSSQCRAMRFHPPRFVKREGFPGVYCSSKIYVCMISYDKMYASSDTQCGCINLVCQCYLPLMSGLSAVLSCCDNAEPGKDARPKSTSLDLYL